MHKTRGQRDPALVFPRTNTRDDADERRQANRAVAISAAGLAITGLVELLLAVLTGSVGLLGDATHNLSDVSTSAAVFLGFRLSRRPPFTADVRHRLADGIDPDVINTAEAAAGSVPGVVHAHARARWTGRTLRVEIEGWIDPDTTARAADDLGRLVADEISRQLPEAGALTWITRAAPV